MTLPRIKRSPLQILEFLILLLACGGVRTARAQTPFRGSGNVVTITNPCTDPSTHPAVKDALRLVCAREDVSVANRPAQHVLVIGFLGGFTKRDEVKHPEVQFANYLSSRYGQTVHAAVFGNHEEQQALKFIHDDIDTDKDGSQAASDRKSAKIILYGHSWGASQVLEFARELERQQIPVALTIQVDSVRKMGQNDRIVPANVSQAVNFYQRKGFTAGRSLIIPANAEQTKILGNFLMTYSRDDIRCDNYGWFSRNLNKPHHQIENDAHVWDQILTLIASELSEQVSE